MVCVSVALASDYLSQLLGVHVRMPGESLRISGSLRAGLVVVVVWWSGWPGLRGGNDPPPPHNCFKLDCRELDKNDMN